MEVESKPSLETVDNASLGQEPKSQPVEKNIGVSIKKEIEDIGFVHFWGLSPAIDFLDKDYG